MMVKRIMLLLVLPLYISVLPWAAGAQTLTVAYPTPTWNTALPLAVAQDQGFFRSEGFDVNRVYVRGGPTVVAALISGDADYAIVAGIPAVRAIAGGAPLVIVGNHSTRVDYTLIGAKNIGSVDDLKGKVVGVTGPGGVSAFATIEALAKKGLHKDKDYKILSIGNSPARMSALEARQIQAAPFSSGERLVLEKKGYPVILDIGETLPDFPFLVVLTSKQKVESRPKEIVSFLRALRRAMELIRNDPEKTVAAAKRQNLGGDSKVERQLLGHYAKSYSIAISESNITALIHAAKLESDAEKIGGAGSFVVPSFAEKASAVQR